MYSEQLAVLLLIAATQMAGQGVGSQPVAQTPRTGAEKTVLQTKRGTRLTSPVKQHAQIKREREAMMLAEFR